MGFDPGGRLNQRKTKDDLRQARSDQVRKKIEATMKLAEAARKAKLLSNRIEFARAGLKAYSNQEYAVAIKSFFTYLKILEEAKNVAHGGLQPSHFDQNRELPELLTLSGVYWDLTKIFDRVKGDQRNFKQFLDKFVLFSRGMPYERICNEYLRRYIAREKPVHRDAFISAYRVLSGNRCFIATSLIDLVDEPTIPVLRRFRDETLRSSKLGRAFIHWYYKNGPALASRVDQSPQVIRQVIAKLIDWTARLLK